MKSYQELVKELRTKEIPQELFGTGWVQLICDAADAVDELIKLKERN